MSSKEDNDWIVRIERRRDGKRYFYRHDGNTTARHESSMRLTKEVAVQLAHANTANHKDFTARACRYDSPVHRRGRKCRNVRSQESLATTGGQKTSARASQGKSASSPTGTPQAEEST